MSFGPQKRKKKLDMSFVAKITKYIIYNSFNADRQKKTKGSNHMQVIQAMRMSIVNKVRYAIREFFFLGSHARTI